jgi:hypothetical protein
MSEGGQASYLFLSGAEMEPMAVRAAHPGARFVARARVATGGAVVAPAFAEHVGDEVWGILVGVPSGADSAPRDVVTDDGRMFAAALGGEELIGGDPAEALAAARYWELPPAYVSRLKAALAVADEDPSDGN